MSLMSDLDILATEVSQHVDSGLDMNDAADVVASQSSYSVEDVTWAYTEKYDE